MYIFDAKVIIIYYSNKYQYNFGHFLVFILITTSSTQIYLGVSLCLRGVTHQSGTSATSVEQRLIRLKSVIEQSEF